MVPLSVTQAFQCVSEKSLQFIASAEYDETSHCSLISRFKKKKPTFYYIASS